MRSLNLFLVSIMLLECVLIMKIKHRVKETKSATMNIFSNFFYFLFKSFVNVELSYVFTIICSL